MPVGKKSFVAFFYVILSVSSFAQSSGLEGSSSVVPKILPPSPNAAALEKFGTIPVDYSTGIPSIGYPMWSWERNKLQFNIGLSYHSGGHKIDDMSPNTGLGWALNGIGRITRTVRGLPDDKPVWGFMYSAVLPQVSTYAYDGNKYIFTTANVGFDPTVNIAITPSNAPYSDTVIEVAQGILDGEQDIFSYNFNGTSGTFIIDKAKNIIPLEHTNIKIEMILNPYSYPLNWQSGNIIGFKITDDKGLVYLFNLTEGQDITTNTDTETVPPIPIQDYISGWLLTEIKDPVVNDSIMIKYRTNPTPTTYETGFSETQTYALETPDYDEGLSVPGIHKVSQSNSFNLISSNEPMADSVIFPDGSLLEMQYDFARADLANSSALTKVSVKNYQSRLIKQFNLQYSYFSSGSGAYYPLWSTSGNDFNKRLRLDGVQEVSSDSLLFKPTLFSYNSMVLNTRSSMNLDYWGYNVNPARNNQEYVPKIPLDTTEIGVQRDFGAYLDGADRQPDTNYVKAAILEKITYPTGGVTTFDYEANKAFSSIDYFENKLIADEVTWDHSAFNSAEDLLMPSRTIINAEFIFKVTEPDVRPPIDPNAPQTCFDDGQDLQPVRFEIKSTDDSVTVDIDGTYSQFLGLGQKRVLALPVDKEYTVKFIYNASLGCAYSYPFYATANCTYFTAPRDKPAGGVRIKKISSNDGSGKLLTKEYIYNDSAGHSSATLNSVPDFAYYRTTRTFPQPGHPYSADIYFIRYINRTSNPTNTLSYFNGSPLIYTVVKEKEKDSSLTERHYDGIASASNGGSGYYPFLPTQDFANFSGLMTAEIIKDKNGVIKETKKIAYDKFKTDLLGQPDHVNNRNVKTGTIATAEAYSTVYYVADQYYMYTTHAVPVTESTTTFEKGDSIRQDIVKTYDSVWNYLRAEKSSNSKHEDMTTTYHYPFDEVTTPYAYMVGNNMVNYVIGSNNKITYPVTSNLQQTSTEYQLLGSTMPVPLNVKTAMGDDSLRTAITFDSYDGKGNILQYTTRDGITKNFLWGYHGSYPVAEVTNSDHATVSGYVNQTILDTTTSDQAMRAELNKIRTGLSASKAMVKTYTYRPLVGVTSETDANGRTLYYEYDGFNRLKLIRDQDSNIVKKFCYNYAGQPEDCGTAATLYFNTAISDTLSRNNCGDSTGSKVIYSIAANAYHSTVSQPAAQALAQGELDSLAQRYANTNGYCIPPEPHVYYNTVLYDTATRNNCGTGYTGSTVIDTLAANTYSSTLSQPAVQAMAQAHLDSTVQAYANAHGVCSPVSGCVSCTSDDHKCILGTCYAGTWECIAAERGGTKFSPTWRCTYAWCFPDGTYSTYHTTTTSGTACTVSCF